ncbi:hypothetical protein, partial [Methylorubrum aminovorans]|uniref:hypothetical protein n=1 Tax=Methylorubrum aminovorans TaxID=269069 RepID=UPI003C2DBEF7
RKRSFSNGRLLRRPHQHDADAPVDGFVTALHRRELRRPACTRGGRGRVEIGPGAGREERVCSGLMPSLQEDEEVA